MSKFPELPEYIARTGAFKVGVFPLTSKRVPRFTAYTMWYNPTWKDCCEHVVRAENGTEAKKLAIAEHKNDCQ